MKDEKPNAGLPVSPSVTSEGPQGTGQVTVNQLAKLAFPTLGDSAKTYPVLLTEPEINTVYALVAFVKAACVEFPFTRFWKHYGGTAQALSNRLTVFDDAPAIQSPTPQQEPKKGTEGGQSSE